MLELSRLGLNHGSHFGAADRNRMERQQQQQQQQLQQRHRRRQTQQQQQQQQQLQHLEEFGDLDSSYSDSSSSSRRRRKRRTTATTASSSVTMEIRVRQVNSEDHIEVVKLFQTFDNEKYKHLRLPTAASSDNNNDDNNRPHSKATLSLAGLRIDERGGIYLNPLLDSNNAYFKCYVAQDMSSNQLIGYILFFNTLDERAGHIGGATDDPVAVIEDLYVKPAYRERGIATQLFRRVLKSSLDRGCFSLECLLIPSSPSGMAFWRRRVGENRINSLLEEQQDSPHELVVELTRNEMRLFHAKLDTPTAATPPAAGATPTAAAAGSSEKENGY